MIYFLIGCIVLIGGIHSAIILSSKKYMEVMHEKAVLEKGNILLDQSFRDSALRQTLSAKKSNEAELFIHKENMQRELLDNIFSIIAPIAKKIIVNGETKARPLSELLKSLDEIIDKEFIHYVVLPRAGKDMKPPITDAMATSSNVCHNIIAMLDPSYYDIFVKHGLSREFVQTYISREVFTKIVMYIQENNELQQARKAMAKG